MADPQRCAFCARPQAQVKTLISGDALGGTSIGICESCVQTSYDMLLESGSLVPRPAVAPAPTDAAGLLRASLRAMPHDIDIAAMRHLASAGIELARGDAAALRILAYDLANARAFEEALRVRVGIATFERKVADSIAEANHHSRIGQAREGLAALDRLAKGPLATKMTPAEQAGASLVRMYAQLDARPWDGDVRAIVAELDTLAPRLPTMGLDASYLLALESQTVHIRARAAMVQGRLPEAITTLTTQLAVRALDLEALALLVEASERVGDRASAARAREKAMKYVPTNSAYAQRLSASSAW